MKPTIARQNPLLFVARDVIQPQSAPVTRHVDLQYAKKNKAVLNAGVKEGGRGSTVKLEQDFRDPLR